MPQTGLDTTITYLISKLYDKFKESIKENREYLKETTADQDTKFDGKIEKQLQPLSLQIKENQLELNEQDNQISSFKASYNEQLENVSTNSKVRFVFEIAKQN